MSPLKVGTRLRSAVCSAEFMVVAAPADRDLDVRCGGARMAGAGEQPASGLAIDSSAAQGSALGKRYVNEAGDLELLCVKPGQGSVAEGGKLLTLKEAKQLPSSD